MRSFTQWFSHHHNQRLVILIVLNISFVSLFIVLHFSFFIFKVFSQCPQNSTSLTICLLKNKFLYDWNLKVNERILNLKKMDIIKHNLREIFFYQIELSKAHVIIYWDDLRLKNYFFHLNFHQEFSNQSFKLVT